MTTTVWTLLVALQCGIVAVSSYDDYYNYLPAYEGYEQGQYDQSQYYLRSDAGYYPPQSPDYPALEDQYYNPGLRSYSTDSFYEADYPALEDQYYNPGLRSYTTDFYFEADYPALEGQYYNPGLRSYSYDYGYGASMGPGGAGGAPGMPGMPGGRRRRSANYAKTINEEKTVEPVLIKDGKKLRLAGPDRY